MLLGSLPVGSTPVADRGWRLRGSSVALAAVGGIIFAGSAVFGAISPLRTAGGIVFGGAPFFSTINPIQATGGIVFGGNGALGVLRNAFIVTALPESFEVRAVIVDFELTAIPSNFTVRGVP